MVADTKDRTAEALRDLFYTYCPFYTAMQGWLPTQPLAVGAVFNVDPLIVTFHGEEIAWSQVQMKVKAYASYINHALIKGVPGVRPLNKLPKGYPGSVSVLLEHPYCERGRRLVPTCDDQHFTFDLHHAGRFAQLHITVEGTYKVTIDSLFYPPE